MSGADDAIMADAAGFNGHAQEDRRPTAGDDTNAPNPWPRQSVKAFQTQLGPVCYDLIDNRLEAIIELGARETKHTLDGTAGAILQWATMKLEPTQTSKMLFSRPLTGYGMICIFRKPKAPGERTGPWLKRQAFNLWASSVEITDNLGTAKQCYPSLVQSSSQSSSLVKIDDVSTIVHSLSFEPRFKFILLYFNTTDCPRKVTFDTSELPKGLKESIDRYKPALGIGNDVTLKREEGTLIIFDESGTATLPGSDREKQQLPDRPADWNVQHVAQWIESIGINPHNGEMQGVAGAKLIELISDSSLNDDLQSSFVCSKMDAAKIKLELNLLIDDPSSMQAAFADLCTL